MSEKRERREKSDKKERKDNLGEKVLFVNRCAKVVTGGRKFSFSALILVGDFQGHVGYGFAKANELTDAIRKGGDLARKNMISFVMKKTSIPHEIFVECDGAQLLLRPAPEGTGVIAGSRVRSVLEFAGIKNVVAKSSGSSNPINQVRCVFKALSELQDPEKVMAMREAV